MKLLPRITESQKVKPSKDQAPGSPEHRLVDGEGYTDVDNARAPPSDIPEI